jgi:hypothetical protein
MKRIRKNTVKNLKLKHFKLLQENKIIKEIASNELF